MCAITGRSRTGTIGLGISNVIGFSRVPRPAARTIAFMRRGKLAQPAGQIGRCSAVSSSIATPSDSSLSRRPGGRSRPVPARPPARPVGAQGQPLDRQRLAREEMSITSAGCPWRRQVDHPPAGQQVQPAPAAARTAARAAARPPAGRSRRRAARAMSTSTSKWPAFAITAPSFIRSKCSARRTPRLPVTVMKRSPLSAASSGRQDLVALHPRLERAQRVDLADDHPRARAAGAQRDAAAGVPVAEHDDSAARRAAGSWRAGCRRALTGRCRSGR